MLLQRIFLLFLVVNIINLGLSQFNLANAGVQVCSCASYYGIPHTCYYSPVTDYDYSCIAKCVREANQ